MLLSKNILGVVSERQHRAKRVAPVSHDPIAKMPRRQRAQSTMVRSSYINFSFSWANRYSVIYLTTSIHNAPPHGTGLLDETQLVQQQVMSRTQSRAFC